MSTPNILLIFTDQHRREGVSAYPGALAQTPRWQGLAAEGMRFDQAYTTCPICAPARASLQTGQYPSRHGMTNNIYQPGCSVHELPDAASLLGKRMQESGYATGFTGKWHLGWGRDTWNDERYMSHLREIDRNLLQFDYPAEYRLANSLPSTRGYASADDFPGHGGGGHAYPQYLDYLKERGLEHRLDRPGANHAAVVSGEESTIDYYLVERSIAHVDALAATGRPWFHTLAFWGPHAPCYVPTAYLEPFRDRVFAPWPSFGEAGAGGCRVHDAKRSGRDWEDVQDGLRHYYAYCEFLDAQTGRLLDHLAATGALDNTVVILAADHGDAQGCHGGLGDKGLFLYEEVAAIPLIVRDPRRQASAPASCDALVSLVDLYATVLDYAGGWSGSDEGGPSRSLRPFVEGCDTAARENLVVQTDALAGVMHSARLLRHGKWAYIFNAGGPEEIYDLSRDPHQLENLAARPEFAATREDLRTRLVEELRKNRDMFASALPAFFRNAS